MLWINEFIKTPDELNKFFTKETASQLKYENSFMLETINNK